MKASLITAVFTALVASTQAVSYPKITTQACTSSGCKTESSTVILDYRWKAAPSEYAKNGVSISGSSLKLALKDGNGPRVYLGESDSAYKMIKMVGNELSYDIETSELGCNMNGALYFVQMPASGAKDGTGYCDANGVGGSYCEEMDIWEANKYATALTAHPSSHDANGCGYNPYAKGSKTLYGAGSSFKVDTTKPFTVVTQFVASGGSVSEIRRKYVQNGKSVDGGALTSECNVAQMGKAMQSGSVLAFSIWSASDLSWLDGGSNGPCPTGSTGKDAIVTFSNIRVGPIGSTTSGSAQSGAATNGTTESETTTTAPTSSGPTTTLPMPDKTKAQTTAPAHTSAAPDTAGSSAAPVTTATPKSSTTTTAPATTATPTATKKKCLRKTHA